MLILEIRKNTAAHLTFKDRIVTVTVRKRQTVKRYEKMGIKWKSELITPCEDKLLIAMFSSKLEINIYLKSIVGSVNIFFLTSRKRRAPVQSSTV